MRRQILLAFGFLAAAQAASAQAIFSATNATVIAGGTAAGTSVLSTIDQSGLSSHYVSGVTDFSTYMASAPSHDPFYGGEWFAPSGAHDADVVYDLGAVKGFDKLAFWNEEAGGVGTLNVFGSNDNVNFFSIAANLSPSNNPLGQAYFANVFSFAATSAQYVLLDMHGCPNANPNWNGCSVGEVAFESAAVESAAPEPASLVLVATGLVGMVGLTRRRRAA